FAVRDRQGSRLERVDDAIARLESFADAVESQTSALRVSSGSHLGRNSLDEMAVQTGVLLTTPVATINCAALFTDSSVMKASRLKIGRMFFIAARSISSGAPLKFFLRIAKWSASDPSWIKAIASTRPRIIRLTTSGSLLANSGRT